MQLFYAPDIKGDTYTLNEVESKHSIRVLRMTLGDSLILVNGKGGLFMAEIIDANVKKCVVEVKEVTDPYEPLDYYLHIAIAPTKNIDRTEWFLEKSTEIGLGEITPLLCQRSERKVVKMERLNKVIVSAMKQSIKAFKPELNKMVSFAEFVKQCEADKKFIAHCEESHDRFLLSKGISKGENICIMIGPEGDFSPEEVVEAKKYGFKEISLGNSRLRTETAGIVACHTVALLNE